MQPVRPTRNRREFLRQLGVATASGYAACLAHQMNAAPTGNGSMGRGRAVWAEELAPAATNATENESGYLKQSLKAGMIRIKDSDAENPWVAKFRAALDAGFVGVEPNTSPGLDVDAMVAASKETGLTIDGTVGGYHWATTHTSPNEATRQKAQQLLEQSLQQTADLGANTFLIVPGHGKDGTAEEVRSRAFDALNRAIPLAEKLGVKILIENVWNHFLYDHAGDSNQSAQALADFVDSFDSPWIGVQFDLGNHWKYGDVAEWVKTLGHRIGKLDIKGFSREQGRFTDVTEGDIDWASVRRALGEINFQGYVAAEVGGGDADRLKKINGQIESALHCSRTLQQIKAESA
ncbi:sugar phosphate isomerase/epimerase family protein [Rhodopirellula halodulae]|uniref:sugar phosphate isomerase/epimerase family protein n=1 Tax=Rhodopirellula halodulae TaxID=2894198 RepID=UPI001E632167|nr:sugar phosphate isomerase/epimerase family protein [Rhodopirellula sp. JC737]MCC9657228.1 sugar phosphate isomerase/epimerase [Rhodopirellula sp. JC737]